MFRDGLILYGGPRGETLSQIAQLELTESWDFCAGRLIMAEGSLVQMIDLVQGNHWSQAIGADGEVVHSDVLWGREGKHLLYFRVTQNDAARRVELRALDSSTGAVIATRDLADGIRATPLYYDDVQNEVSLVVQGEKGESKALEVVSLQQDDSAASYPVRGRLPVSLDRDAHQVAYLALNKTSVCTQEVSNEDSAQCTALPEGQMPTSYAWSSRGDQLALMLQPQPGGDAGAPSDAGLWVLSLDDRNLHQVLAHEGPMSEVLGWSPADEMILARHSGGDIPDHVYLIRPDGGDRRILPSSERIIPLGWMPSRAPNAPEVQLDPWVVRFASQAADAQALADTTAQWLATTEAQSDTELTKLLRDYVETAGWQTDLAGPQVVRVSEGLHVAQLPPLAIYVCEQGRAYAIASGHLIQDVRQDGDHLGMIYATIGASSVNPDFVLAERDAQGWRVAWTPQGQRYWIATDGEISFVSQRLNRLVVRGSSFGLDLDGGDPFRECHACLHRWLQAEWVRTDSTYTLAMEGAASKPRDEVLWALTDRTPYAVLHETIRRMRIGKSATELADAQAQTHLRELGLLDPQRVLVGEQETAETVIFSDLETEKRYRAEVRQGRLVSVTRMAG